MERIEVEIAVQHWRLRRALLVLQNYATQAREHLDPVWEMEEPPGAWITNGRMLSIVLDKIDRVIAETADVGLEGDHE